MKRLWTVLTIVVLAGMVLSACAAPAAAPAAAPEAGGEAAAPAGEAVDFVTWYQYDEKNEDPASDERVGNQYLRDT
ncbi:MAG: hypothetical protein KDE01_14845, partial [Caldilineaceae bacterium]|nr:hypothetical protein [Caldilineaceae bacterium]MCB0148915.1 hypothetical protein [Caldilineaceae bacterium]